MGHVVVDENGVGEGVFSRGQLVCHLFGNAQLLVKRGGVDGNDVLSARHCGVVIVVTATGGLYRHDHCTVHDGCHIIRVF